MTNLIKTLLISSILFLVVGCGGGTPQPVKAKSSIPSWYLNSQQANSNYYYGVGEGDTKENANAKALSAIAGLISTSVASSMDISESDSTKDGYFQESKSNIKTSTQTMKFTGIAELQNEYIDGVFYANVQVDRVILFNAQKKLLDNDYKKALTSWNQTRSKGAFSIVKHSPKVIKLVDSMLSRPTLEILKSINPAFDLSAYREKILNIKNDVIDAKSQVSMIVKTQGKLSSYYKDVLKKYISSDGIILINNKSEVSNEKNVLTVVMSVEAKKKNVKTSDPRLRGATFAAVTVSLTTKNYKNRVVAQNRVEVLNISKDGFDEAKIKTKKFEKQIKKEGILNILLKTK